MLIDNIIGDILISNARFHLNKCKIFFLNPM
jgi:hypothetical protein